MSFYGGTDAAPALHKALEMLGTKEYEKADVVMVSDFVMPGLDSYVQERLAENKKKGTKFHSLVIGGGGNKAVMASFDHNWHYDASSQNGMLSLIRHMSFRPA
jgi:uncharacterized protein with von Willebrand factor type A (vWA) domain